MPVSYTLLSTPNTLLQSPITLLPHSLAARAQESARFAEDKHDPPHCSSSRQPIGVNSTLEICLWQDSLGVTRQKPKFDLYRCGFQYRRCFLHIPCSLFVAWVWIREHPKTAHAFSPLPPLKQCGVKLGDKGSDPGADRDEYRKCLRV